MSIREQLIALRKQTGAGLLACKEALGQAGGDYEAALKQLIALSAANATANQGTDPVNGLVDAYIHGDGVSAYASRVAGRLEKLLREQCLLEQAWVRDSRMRVSELVRTLAAASGERIRVVGFTRYELPQPPADARAIAFAKGLIR